jgi:hypothetical protein
MTSTDSTKSFASVAANAKGATGYGQMGDGGFKTRQRPDAIRNSNIVAAKGIKNNLIKNPKINFEKNFSRC